MSKITYLQAILAAIREEMRRDPATFVMGEDLSIWGTADGLSEEFGRERVRNTPISEAGFIGAAAGAAVTGGRPIVDVTISSFIYPAMDQVVSIIAKSRYLYGGQAKMPLVLRLGLYHGLGVAAQHSDRPYSMFMNVPGLKIVIPSNPYDMKGLLKSAIRDDNPVMVFEDTNLWNMRDEVPDEEYLVEIGKANVVREGSDVTIVAIGGMLRHALAAADELAEEGVQAEVLDPRTLVPFDQETLLQSVSKTGRLVVVDVAHRTCSAASEIAAIVAEDGFWHLRAPLVRVTTPDTHIPHSPAIEHQLYPDKEKIIAAVHKTFA
ncbi:alpha-ketoacid dehydrogenase subunit beta [Kineobactrum salinum]|uniref:2-oxoisovalerate dehydrogenase subunit beta n=1 Tax=Kineobactrum salinum TaxID=2708301 RepID=A0A6C0U1F9_9GAMM|nr:transketolase C-terminal domain-containing protein [Kineobactrum salinum]QIB65623.1 alpha-ketoacid dehydrogenase subunit beta [Kineobactrum salinum]